MTPIGNVTKPITTKKSGTDNRKITPIASAAIQNVRSC